MPDTPNASRAGLLGSRAMTSSSESSVPPAAAVGWYYLLNGVQVGPLSERELLDIATRGEITPDTLVWQPSFRQRWKPAASIPMIAVSLGCFGQLGRDRSTAWSRRTNQNNQQQPSQTFSEAALERLTPADLDDAVNEEEAAEPVLDAQQMHEILERASCHPPERSIPPATVRDSLSPAPRVKKRHFGSGYLLAIGAGSVLVGITGVVLSTIPWHSSRVVEAQAQPSLVALNEVHPAANPTAASTVNRSALPSTSVIVRDTSAIANTASAAASVVTDPVVSSASDKSAAVETAGAAEKSAVEDVTANLQIAATPAVDKASRVSVTSGPLEAQAFETRLKRARPMFDRQCWDRLRLRLDNVTEHPEVRVEISVDRTGHVYDVVSSKAPRGYHGAGLCIIGRMRGWRFPITDGNTHAVMTVARGHD